MLRKRSQIAARLCARLLRYGPGVNAAMTVLATAFSDPSNTRTAQDEPQLMALQYSKGRVFHTTMGHDIVALGSVDFSATSICP